MNMPSFAPLVPLSVGALRNIACGHTTTTATRLKITNLLGVPIFENIPVTERSITFPAGAEIEMPSEEEAIAAEKEFATCTERRGRTVCFVKATPATLLVEDYLPKASQPG